MYRRPPGLDIRGEPPPPMPPDQPPLQLYDVLMDPQHPAFADLGRLLWTLIPTQPAWVDRRVETASLAGERRFRRHMSVDCRVPPSVLELALALGFSRFLVPLRLVSKRGPMLAFDLRLDDQPVPWLTRPQNSMAARAVLYAAVDQLGQDLTPDLEQVLGEVAGTDTSSAHRALDLLGLTTPGRVGESATPAELVHWLVTTLDHNFMLLADVGIPQVRRRTVFKITQELGLTVKEPLPLRSQVAWGPTSFVFDCPDVTAASSYHFQFVAPDGMVVTGGEMFGASLDDDGDTGPAGAVGSGGGGVGAPGGASGPGGGSDPAGARRPVGGSATGPGSRAITAGRPSAVADRASFGTSASQGSVLGLNTHIGDVPEAGTYNVEVLVCPSADGLLRACAVSSAFTAVLLFLAAWFSYRLDTGRLDASIALLLVLPGIISTQLARPGEHHLVSRLLRGVRILTLSSAVTLYFAAAMVVAGLAGSALQAWWLGLAVVSGVPAVLLGVAVRRCRLRMDV
ncbi:MAG: hypothetical protein ACRD2C_09085 [Acidimicrobiales bacterium]